LAWIFRFIQDDAFISFRYAKNFAEGHGLVYNPGEKVEGYTNFLWTLFLTTPHLLHMDIISFSQTAGVLLFALSLYLTYGVAQKLTGNIYLAALALIFTGSNFTFLSYATGGLETQLFTLLVMTAFYLAVNFDEKKNNARLFTISLVFAMLLLTRPDSVPYIAIILLYLFYKMHNLKCSIKNYLMLIAPFILLSAAYLLWKLSYYGDLLPNTFYAKVHGGTSSGYGIYYIFTFFKSYLIILFPLLIFFLLRKKVFSIEITALLMLLAFNILYVFYVGGDFMEFRFFVPVIPMFFILIVLTFREMKQKVLITILSLIIPAGSLSHAFTFKSESGHQLFSIKELNGQIYNDNFSWMKIGKYFNKYFNNSDITIATTAAGVIPYYSNLRTIDMHGLSDRQIARSSINTSKRPGHQKLAAFEYLLEKDVNILVGHPFVMWNTFDTGEITASQFKTYFMYDLNTLPAEASIIKMPMDNGYCMFFVYLQKNKFVDSIINKEGWETKDISSITKHLVKNGFKN
jgi:hypothetical protein